MKIVIERIQHTFLVVDADNNESAIRKAKINDALEIKPGSTLYAVRTIGLGDKIASNPIVKAVGKATGCVDKAGQLKPESGCGKMKARLNSGMSIKEAALLRLKGK